MKFHASNGQDPPSAGVVGTSEIKQLMAKCLSRINELPPELSQLRAFRERGGPGELLEKVPVGGNVRCTKLSDALVAASRAVQLAVARRATASQETSKLQAPGRAVLLVLLGSV